MTSPVIDFQPVLKNDLVIAVPLTASHFDELYAAASDLLIWEQHPNKNRYQLKEFENYFRGAIVSGGAFLVKDAQTNEVIGSSRYSDYDPATNTVSIGYTFFIRSHWGSGHNYTLKKLMLDHIFNFVDTVTFYIGAVNKRSQISLERFGAIKTGEAETAYYGEAPKLDYIYTITKEQWLQLCIKMAV
ncbi:GNAT family N-acetyltransferase [Ferruginibacter sp.]|nr:GNAT family N-acetyltransferase [Ferruginibacter sp.]